MEIPEWRRTNTPTWNTRLAGTPHQALPETLLGKEDAAEEWGETEKPVNIFTRIDTYQDFRSPNSLYLFGRRGSGKTTIIRMLDHEIKSGDSHEYKTCWVADSHGVLLEIATQAGASVLTDLKPTAYTEALTPVWLWYFNVSAMLAVTERSRDLPGEAPEIKATRLYLQRTLGDYVERPRGRLHEVLRERLVRALEPDGAARSVGSAMQGITQNFSDDDHHRAVKSLIAITKKKPVLVMLDAGEAYEARRPDTNAVISALINAVHWFRVNRGGAGTYVKAAFPSEVLPHVLAFNRGKIEGKTVVIIWTHHDLVSFLAKRYSRHILANARTADLDRLNSYPIARKLLYEHLPATVKMRSGVTFDTLAYIARHTLKTPRQMIILMNSVLTYAKREALDFTDLRDRQDVIVDGVHARLDHLVLDAIDMHKFLYPDVEHIVRRVLSDCESHFAATALDARMKAIRDIRASDDLGRFDVVRVLFEVGVLGVAHQAHQIGEAQWLLEGRFEYQVKDTLVVNNESWCMIHPMFFEWLRTKVDVTTMNYPVAFENEEREVLNALRGHSDAQ